MILLNDKALKYDFFICIRDQAPKNPLQLENEKNDTCAVTNTLPGRHERGTGPASLESRWLQTTSMDVGLNRHVQLLS